MLDQPIQRIMIDDIPENVGKRFGDLQDLPPELLNQIPAVRIDKLEAEVLDVIKMLNGVASVDEVLVGLYRVNNEIHDRQKIANKLYRMTSAGHLKSVPQKRGVYKIP